MLFFAGDAEASASVEVDVFLAVEVELFFLLAVDVPWVVAVEVVAEASSFFAHELINATIARAVIKHTKDVFIV